jgi:hypothetical protein
MIGARSHDWYVLARLVFKLPSALAMTSLNFSMIPHPKQPLTAPSPIAGVALI